MSIKQALEEIARGTSQERAAKLAGFVADKFRHQGGMTYAQIVERVKDYGIDPAEWETLLWMSEEDPE